MDEATITNDGIPLYEMGDILKYIKTHLEDRIIAQKECRGISSGFVELDEATGGFNAPELAVLASRPSAGKTALALSMLRHITLEENTAAGFFSLEMAAHFIGRRLLVQEAMIQVNMSPIRKITRSEFSRLTGTMEKLTNAPICLTDKPVLTVAEIHKGIQRMVSAYGVRVVFIDYLSLIKEYFSTVSRPEQILKITTMLKNMTREFGISIIALVQMNRNDEPENGSEKDGITRRTVDIISEEADTVLVLNRQPGEHSKNAHEAELIITKQRNGPSGIVHLRFLPEFSKFENYVL
jgi:replicative DNA helicase